MFQSALECSVRVKSQRSELLSAARDVGRTTTPVECPARRRRSQGTGLVCAMAKYESDDSQVRTFPADAFPVFGALHVEPMGFAPNGNAAFFRGAFMFQAFDLFLGRCLAI